MKNFPLEVNKNFLRLLLVKKNYNLYLEYERITNSFF
jgi:hypothetical protein